MNPRAIATLSVVALITLWFSGQCAWNEWKQHRMETIHIGATKAEVLAALGQPDNSPANKAFVFGGCAATATAECWEWKLYGRNYLTVCLDRAGKVVCRESFTIWT